jgi:hypothetical protein
MERSTLWSTFSDMAERVAVITDVERGVNGGVE